MSVNRSEDNLKYWVSPFALFETGSLASHCLHQASWCRILLSLPPISPYRSWGYRCVLPHLGSSGVLSSDPQVAEANTLSTLFFLRCTNLNHTFCCLFFLFLL